MKEVPDALSSIVDKVLAYRPKPKTKGAKKRKPPNEKHENKKRQSHEKSEGG